MNIKKIIIFLYRLITNPINYVILKFNGAKYRNRGDINTWMFFVLYLIVNI